MDKLLEKIRICNVCAPHLELGTNPVLTAHPNSKIVIIGQAPGIRVHRSGIPWDDKSGDNLRNWLQVGKETFYNPETIALLPMGFCYPGKSKNSDLPPRKECAPLWHKPLLSQMKKVRLIILVGKYAHDYYLKEKNKNTLTDTVKNFEDYLPNYFVLPHPSPRNNIWRAKNKWFDEKVIPRLRDEIRRIV